MAIHDHLMKAVADHAAKGLGKRGVEKADAKGAREHLKGDVSEMTIKKAENGFLVTHHHDGGHMGTYKPSKSHVFAHHEGKEMADHIQKFMGCYDPSEDESADVEKGKVRRTEGGSHARSGRGHGEGRVA